MKKLLTSLFILSLLLTATVGTVFAQDTTPITGTIKGVAFVTDSTTGDTLVEVTVVDDQGNEQTVLLTVETAETLGIVTVDPTTGEATLTTGILDTNVEIQPEDVITPPDGGGDNTDTTGDHPVGSMLATAFEDLGVDYDKIMENHDNGMGFGVIAQALWLTEKLGGDAEMFQAILDAKKSGDYSAITLPDGSTPTNWGQFMKAAADGDKMQSVGYARNGVDVERVRANEAHKNDSDENDPGNGNGQGNGNGNNGNHGNNGNNGNHGNGGGNGNGNGGGNGHGKP